MEGMLSWVVWVAWVAWVGEQGSRPCWVIWMSVRGTPRGVSPHATVMAGNFDPY
jgi:hypothetical protein